MISRQINLDKLKSDFWELQYRYMMILDISKRILHIKRWEISNILWSLMNFKCKVDGRTSVSATPNEDILSGTDVSGRPFIQRYLLSFICFLSTLCRGSNSLKILGGLTDQVWFQSPGFSYSCDIIFSVWFCYEQ